MCIRDSACSVRPLLSNKPVIYIGPFTFFVVGDGVRIDYSLYGSVSVSYTHLQTIRPHSAAEDALTGGHIYVGRDEAADFGVVVAGGDVYKRQSLWLQYTLFHCVCKGFWAQPPRHSFIFSMISCIVLF